MIKNKNFDEVNDDLFEISQWAFDLALDTITTDGLPSNTKSRAYALYRRLQKLRNKYDLRTRREVETNRRDIVVHMDNNMMFSEYEPHPTIKS